MRFLVIDVETPNRYNDRISAISCILVEGMEIKEKKYSLCDPEAPSDPFNVALTGLSDELLSTAPTFPELWPTLAPLFENSVIVAHNAPFDLNVLHKCLVAYQLSIPNIQYCCTYRMSRKLWPYLENHKLNTICEYLSFPLDHHNASSDAMACANILITMLKDHFPVEKYISLFSPGHSGSSGNSAFRAKLSDRTKKINELLGILSEISADGILTESEIRYLITWLSLHENLRGEYQFDKLYDTISAALEDGYIDGSELNQLLSLCRDLIDPIGNLKAAGTIALQGKSVCLTGNFDHGSRAEVEALVKTRGGSIAPGVAKTLDYLIVGGQGSSAWASGNYGTKVKKALELQAQGFPIQIVREADIFDPVCGGI